MTVFDNRTEYKPFIYPWAYEGYKSQSKMHWIPDEVPMHEDVKDWNIRLSGEEKNLLTQIFRFFTQGDVDVANSYRTIFAPSVGHPELSMMMLTFAAMEAVHIDAYSNLIETVGMPESEYQAFLDYKEMADKHDYLSICKRDLGKWNSDEVAMLVDKPTDYIKDYIKCVAVFSAFTEGLQLFSSFAILMNFPRFGKMKGMGQIVSWSIRDESLHVEKMIQFFHTLCEEFPDAWDSSMAVEVSKICDEIVNLEDNFVDLAFEQGGIEGLTSDEVKLYVRYIANRRLTQLGLGKLYDVEHNPLPWLESLINAPEHANFFEQRATEYSKGSLTGDWNEVNW